MKEQEQRVIVIGGGAAGIFAAISAKTHHPESDVWVLERSIHLLAKVKVSGGGRCNVTHAIQTPAEIKGKYPRGERQLIKAFSQFGFSDTVKWFESRGVKLKTEPDNRMFPTTNQSQTIIDCLLKEAENLGIKIILSARVTRLEKQKEGFVIQLENREPLCAHKVIVASGGSPKREGFEWLESLGHLIVPPVPSLFTFNLTNTRITELPGVSVPMATIKIQGTQLKEKGPLLITHWGLSGPAVLKLSAWGARILSEKNYQFKVNLNWLGTMSETEIRELIQNLMVMGSGKKIYNWPASKTDENRVSIPSRLWTFLLEKIEINESTKWDEIGKATQNKLLNILMNDEYEVEGKTTFKEEFVTCGGVSHESVDFKTMASKNCPGIYFAGEILDVDGITGGFNFQAAWTTGFIAGKLG